jgi:hypothetical protein
MDLIPKLVLYLSAIVVLTACGAHEFKPTSDSQNISDIAVGCDNGFNLEQDSLWELKIEQRGHEKFSGIVALKKDTDILTLVLLDPTGLKLFEENISNNGTVSLTQNLSFFEDHQLPKYLGKVFYRTFFKFPTADSCSGNLYNLCWEKCGSQFKKRAKWGPFTLWNVIYGGNSTGAYGHNIEHHSPWIGTTFYLKLL